MALEHPAEIIRDVGLRIAEARRSAGLTQEEMAERLGIALRNYQRIELGKRNLTLKTMAKIGGILGVPVRVFMDEPASRATRRGRPRGEPRSK